MRCHFDLPVTWQSSRRIGMPQGFPHARRRGFLEQSNGVFKALNEAETLFMPKLVRRTNLRGTGRRIEVKREMVRQSAVAQGCGLSTADENELLAANQLWARILEGTRREI